MSVLELKQEISRLTSKERLEIQGNLLRLKRQSPAWKRSAAKTIREMKAGKAHSSEDLEKAISRG